jgi:hypothetical protein
MVVIPKVNGPMFRRRAEELLGEYRLLHEAVRLLLSVQEVVHGEIAGLTRKLIGSGR